MYFGKFCIFKCLINLYKLMIDRNLQIIIGENNFEEMFEVNVKLKQIGLQLVVVWQVRFFGLKKVVGKRLNMYVIM